MALSSCEGRILEGSIGSTFVDGYGPKNYTACLENGLDGIVVYVGGGEYPEDVSWEIVYPSGKVKTGVAGSFAAGTCVSPNPSPLPSLSAMPTEPCELYAVEISDNYGDG